MPTYRSITLSVVSQHDIYNLPEYPPPSTPNDPFSSLPTLISEDRALVSVYIPTFPGSQFWISYSISPPYPPKALYYFKLYLKGKCLVSWGCGEENGYRGRTMFALYDSGENWLGESGVERRAFRFDTASKNEELISDDWSNVMEIKIYRAKGRHRIRPLMNDFHDLTDCVNDTKGQKANSIGSVSLVRAGFLTARDPQRFYKYALLDPLDKPFATFHYIMRTWEQLRDLGVVSASQSPTASVYAHEPAGRSTSPRGSNQTISSNQTTSSSSSSSNTQEHSFVCVGKQPTASPPRWAIFAPKLTKSASAEQSPQKASKLSQPKILKRRMHRAVTAPSLVSLSPSKDRTVKPAKFTSLVRGARTPSPPRSGAPTRIPTPKFRTTSIRRTPTPSLAKRASATRVPTPTPKKQDMAPERSPTRSVQPVQQLPRSRSGSIALLMSAVDSAINRRQDVTQRDAEEWVPHTIPDFPTAEDGQSGSLQKQLQEDTQSDNEQISLNADEIPKDGTLDAKNDPESISMAEENSGADIGGAKAANANSLQSANDASSARKKRWGIWGGIKQNKGAR